MPRSWSRPYPPGRGRWWVVLWEAGALAYLHWTTSRMLDLTATSEAVLAASRPDLFRAVYRDLRDRHTTATALTPAGR